MFALKIGTIFCIKE